MMCAWQELLRVLPLWMRERVDSLGRGGMQELRLRLDKPPELVLGSGSRFLDKDATKEDLAFVVNTASRYSPWAAETVSKGYLTVRGGHRIGICGEAVTDHEDLKGIRKIRSLCIRVARDFPNIENGLPLNGSVLIIGKPGCGKTTLLRDLIRQRSLSGTSSIAVVDERGELFPEGFETGPRTDILSGCDKKDGIPILLRTMGPGTLAIDEITAQEDVLYQAVWCGVDLLATAHAGSLSDLERRAGYRKILESGIFQTLVILQQDKSWRTERMSLC